MTLFPPNGWTGAQYSTFRAILATYLFVHFVDLVPWAAEMFSSDGVLPRAASPLVSLFPNLFLISDAPWVATGAVALGAALSLLLLVGCQDRWAALGLWYLWACLLGRNPLISNPGLPYIGFILLAHAALPRAPYGSIERSGQPDPGAGWRVPDDLFRVAWVLLALGYTYSGYTKLISPSWVDGTAVAAVLQGPLARPGALRELLLGQPELLRLATWGALGLELAFAPLALVRAFRPWLWLSMVGFHFGLMAMIDFADLSLGMVMIHLFTFDPGWIRPKAASAKETIFYDGSCALCHRAVRLVLSEDRPGHFGFSPLQGAAFQRATTPEQRAAIGDSVVIRTDDGRLLSRSAAAMHVALRLGGVWGLLGRMGMALPSGLLDVGYELVCRYRYRVFGRKDAACPILPKELRARFDLEGA